MVIDLRCKMRKIAIVSFLLLGCSTPYQPMGFGGGYSDVQYDRNTIKVSFRGNAFISKDTVNNYLLYRCAETTTEHGYDYFIIVDSNSDIKYSTYTTPGRYEEKTRASGNLYGYGNRINASGTSHTAGTYYPSKTTTFKKHKITAMIKMFNGRKPKNEKNAYNARELMHYLSPNIAKQTRGCL